MFNCEYCKQRYADTDKCCDFCGAPLPTIERATFSPEKVIDTALSRILFPSRRINANSAYAIYDVPIMEVRYNG